MTVAGHHDALDRSASVQGHGALLAWMRFLDGTHPSATEGISYATSPDLLKNRG